MEKKKRERVFCNWPWKGVIEGRGRDYAAERGYEGSERGLRFQVVVASPSMGTARHASEGTMTFSTCARSLALVLLFSILRLGGRQDEGG